MKRSDISKQYKWNLEDIYENEQAWEDDFKKVEQLIESTIKPLQGKISKNPIKLLLCLETDEQISLLLERLYVYAALKRDEDTRNTTYQALLEKAGAFSVKASNATSFIAPEILSMDEDILNGFYKVNPSLLHYKKMIDTILRSKAHVLSSEKEEVLSQIGDISTSPSTIFNMLNNADIEFPVIQDENGDDIQLTKSNYIEFMESSNREVRKNAFKSLYDSYIKQKNTIAATLHANIKKNVFYSNIRKYPSSLEKSLFHDDVSIDVYDNLIKTVKDNLDPMHKYLEIRKKLLKLDDLHVFDLYTPLISEVDKKISYDEAYDTMKKGLAPLGNEYINVLEKAYDSGWIDVYENKGKRGGAYQWGPYGSHPYVLLNHKDNLNSMFTLAHEMGHAMHSYYSDKSNPYLYAQYTIFVAEVASTVNEVLLMHHLLNETTDKKERMYLINYFLEQFRGTIYRQTMFAEFEKITHEKVHDNIPLTVDSFSDIYLDLNKQYYGDGVVLDEEVKYEWMRIPHFYNAFYVYKYATGFSAAVAIAKRILNEGDTARDEYLEFLKSGGTNFPIELLKIAGVDMSNPKPIEDALSYFSELVDELEDLIEE